MIFLIIDKPGLVIRLPNSKPVRTPAEINITGKDLNIVISYLKQYGVSNYKIVNKFVDKKKIKSKQKEKEENKSIDLSELNARFDNIESLLINLLNSEPTKHTEYIIQPSEKSGTPKVEELNDEIDFIPEILSDNMTLTNPDVKIKESDENIDDSVESLKSLKLKSKEKYKK